MNAPPAFVLLFGHWLGFLVALAVGGTHVVIWYHNQLTVPWWVLALGLFVMAQALRVRWRYTQYRDWRRAAEELSGAADMRRAVAARRRPVLIALASVALWFGCIWWVGTHSARDPTSEVAAVLWFGISLAWLWMGVRRLWRWISHKRLIAAAQRERDHVVALALSAPRNGPTVDEARTALPDYCKALLARSADGAQ
jgi:hypothetical protein